MEVDDHRRDVHGTRTKPTVFTHGAALLSKTYGCYLDSRKWYPGQPSGAMNGCPSLARP